jgi:transcriptional regulator with XRE-family HTH domain
MPIEWRAVVTEALRRRKAEKLTQREHAALAGVSIPTIAAFDRGERTLTLAKAFDILRVVGLVEEPAEDGAQEAFVLEAVARWRELISSLPKESAGRFPHGWYRFDYALEGPIAPVTPRELEKILPKVQVPHTGYPMFAILTRPEFAPQEVDGVLECWLKPGDAGIDRAVYDAAHCDFWRASGEGRLVLMRGYQEDAQETFAPGTVFDTTLPIWRMSEALLHASRLAAVLKATPDAEISVQFRALYTGLSGRVLRSWANPLADLFIEGGAARSDEALLETTVSIRDIEENLAGAVFPLASSLFERFGVTGLSAERVEAEIQRMKRGRFG